MILKKNQKHKLQSSWIIIILNSLKADLLANILSSTWLVPCANIWTTNKHTFGTKLKNAWYANQHVLEQTLHFTLHATLLIYSNQTCFLVFPTWQK